MKIAFYEITSTISPGGVQTTIWELANEFASKGIEAHVYGGHGPIRPANLHPSIKIFTFPYIHREKIPNFGTRFQRILERLSMAFYSRKSLLNEDYNIIVFTKPFDFIVPFILGSSKKIRFAFASGGTDFFLGDKYLSRRIDFWFSCSHFNAWQIMSHYKKFPKVIYNGVDINKFRPIPRDHELMKSLGINVNEVVFIFAGRLVGWKGVKYIIKAMSYPQISSLPVKLVIIGNGFEKEKLRLQAADLGLQDRVRFLDFISHDDLPRFYSIADIAVYPSIGDEAFGISIAEAMACGKPVIAAYNGGIPEVVGSEEDCGFLVSLANAEEIAEKMLFLAKNPDIRSNMGRQARHRIEKRFTWRNSADCFLREITSG